MPYSVPVILKLIFFQSGFTTTAPYGIDEFTGRDVYEPEYEEIEKSDRINSVGCAAYVERNQELIDSSAFVVVKINERKNCAKSGIKLAYDYAIKKEI